MLMYVRFVDGSPDGVPFASICFTVRVVEALGAAALITSSFAIIANTFPNNVTAMFVRTTLNIRHQQDSGPVCEWMSVSKL